MGLSFPNVSIENVPLPVDGSGVVQPVSGSVSVSNFPATQPISGTIAVSNFPAIQPVSGPLTNTELRASAVPVSVGGTVSVITAVASSATVTQVTSTAAAQTLLASNVNRKSAILYFTSGNWNIKYGTAPTATSFTVNISSAGATFIVTGWTGDITALCTTANKIVNVTELV